MKQIALALSLMGLASVAFADTTVKIGFAGPLTGPISHIGKEEENGMRLALEDANAKGTTIAGQKIKFEVLARR